MKDLVKINEMEIEIDIDQLLEDVEFLKDKNEEDILAFVGRLLVDNGYTVSDSGDCVIVPDEEFSAQKSYTSLMQSDGFTNAAKATKTTKTAKAKGKKFKARLKDAICTNTTIFKLLGDGGKNDDAAKDTIKKILPDLLKLLGIGSAGSVAGIWLGIIAAALALLLKLGYDAYCKAYWKKNGKPNAAKDGDNQGDNGIVI